jgi:lysylphosphatidylglycerol synthetase-like protein (DUF2156 family)
MVPHPLDPYIETMTIVAAALAIAAFVFYTFANYWWWTRSGIATWLMSLAWVGVIVHFVGEAAAGQAQGREAWVVTAVVLTTAWNLATMIWKNYFYDPVEGARRDADRWNKVIQKKAEKERRKAARRAARSRA